MGASGAPELAHALTQDQTYISPEVK